MKSNDAILTVCHRMPFSKTAAFVKSLNATEFAGQCHFFCSFCDDETVENLRRSNIDIHAFLFLARHVRQRLATPWPLWRRFFAVPQPQWLADAVSRRVLHLFYLRHLLYLRFLEQSPNVSRVLMCDCRDVYFQTDPFRDWPGDGLHAFEEDRTTLIGDCEHHRRWISQLAPPGTLEKLTHFPRVCAGTIMGDRHSAIRFLRKMLEMTYAADSLEPQDGDQGLFNILVHERRIEEIVVHRNSESSVSTIGGTLGEKITTDSEGFVTCPNGRRVPILHQYDRKPDIAKPLLARLGL